MHVHGFFFDIREHFLGKTLHPDFGVSHGSGRIAVNGAEVALAVYKGVAHRKILGHADNGIVYGGIAVRMVFTDDISDDSGRFLVWTIVGIGKLVHSEQYPAVDWLKTVPHIRYGPPDDNAHGIIKV